MSGWRETCTNRAPSSNRCPWISNTRGNHSGYRRGSPTSSQTVETGASRTASSRTSDISRQCPAPAGPALLAGVVVRVDLRVLRPLLGELVLGEAGVDGARLDAGIAVDALVGVDVEHLGRLVVGLVGGRVDAVDRTDLDARVVLRPDARLGDDVGQAWLPFVALSVRSGGPPRRSGQADRTFYGDRVAGVILLTGATGTVGKALLPG